jgi:hypothetical protein
MGRISIFMDSAPVLIFRPGFMDNPLNGCGNQHFPFL